MVQGWWDYIHVVMTKMRISWCWFLTQMLDLHHPILLCALCWRLVSFKSSFSFFYDVLYEILFIINFLCFGISNAGFTLVEELPDNWNDAPDIHSLRSMDRSFVFPGIYFSLDSLYFFHFWHALVLFPWRRCCICYMGPKFYFLSRWTNSYLGMLVCI